MQGTIGIGTTTPLARDKAHEWVKENAARTVLAAAVPMPVPLGHSLLTTAIEAYMIVQISSIYGRKLTVKEAVALIPVLGVTMGAGKLAALAAGELLTYIPVVGWAAKGGIGAGIAYLIGKKAIVYFESKSPGQLAEPFEITLSLKELITSIVQDKATDVADKDTDTSDKCDDHDADDDPDDGGDADDLDIDFD